MRRWTRAFLWAAAVACALAPCLTRRGGAERPGLAARVLGPIASLAASVEWVLADRDLSGGRAGRGFARAETALELQPGPAAGWSFLAAHLVHQRSTLDAEPDPAERLRWVDAALALLERGERESDEPDELAFHAGLILAYVALLPEVYPFPGGPAAAWDEAARHFDRAAELGHRLGADNAAAARASARAAR